MVIFTVLKVLAISLLLLLLLAVAIVLIGIIVPVNRKYRPEKNGINCYISSNGLHTEFILPAIHPIFDWTKIIDPQFFEVDTQKPFYYGLGWGDKAIYLDLENWNELTFRQGFNCLVLPTASIMHIKSYETLPPNCTLERLSITPAQYSSLCEFIFSSFALDENQKVKLIDGAGYTPQDNFYHAVGKYHAFQTCNYWVNKGLKKIGVRAPLWTPIDKGLFYQLKKVKIPYTT